MLKYKYWVIALDGLLPHIVHYYFSFTYFNDQIYLLYYTSIDCEYLLKLILFYVWNCTLVVLKYYLMFKLSITWLLTLFFLQLNTVYVFGVRYPSNYVILSKLIYENLNFESWWSLKHLTLSLYLSKITINDCPLIIDHSNKHVWWIQNLSEASKKYFHRLFT